MFDGQGPRAGSRLWLTIMLYLSGRPLENTFGLTARDTGGKRREAARSWGTLRRGSQGNRSYKLFRKSRKQVMGSYEVQAGCNPVQMPCGPSRESPVYVSSPPVPNLSITWRNEDAYKEKCWLLTINLSKMPIIIITINVGF